MSKIVKLGGELSDYAENQKANEILAWLKENLDPTDYELHDIGYMYSEIIARLDTERAITLFTLRWE